MSTQQPVVIKKTVKSAYSLERRNAMAGRMFCIPLYIGILLFFGVPLLQSLWYSFNSVTTEVGRYATEFVGIGNFYKIFRENAKFMPALVSSLGELAYKVPVVLIASLFFALILNQKFRGRVLTRAIFFLPVIIASGVVLSVIMSDSAANSMMNGVSADSGSGSYSSIFDSSALQDFLIEAGLDGELVGYFGRIANSLFDLLWMTGIQMIMFLAGLQSVSPSLYEASAMEGATAWENFWMITFPSLTPILLVNTVYTIVDTFTDSSNPVMVQIYNQYSALSYGVASAMSWSYFVIIGVILAAIMLIFSLFQRDTYLIKARKAEKLAARKAKIAAREEAAAAAAAAKA